MNQPRVSALLLVALLGCGTAKPKPAAHADRPSPVPGRDAVCGSVGAKGVTGAERETFEAHRERILTIGRKDPGENADALNKELDGIWTDLERNPGVTAPLVREALVAELARPKPSGFLLLDMGFFLARFECEPDRELVVRTLLAIDTEEPAVQASQQHLFFYAHGLARKGRRELLPLFDEHFLRTELPVFLAAHFLELDATLQCVFLYGVLGPESEDHLARLLGRLATRTRVLEVLSWIGTERSASSVRDALYASPDLDTAKRAVGYLMRVGGPPGRRALLDLDVSRLSPDAKEYVSGMRADVEAHTFDRVRDQLAEQTGSGPRLEADEARRRLDRMEERFGFDDETHPLSIIESDLPRAELVTRLSRIRSRTLHRLSDEALSEVEVHNLVLNAVQYRK